MMQCFECEWWSSGPTFLSEAITPSRISHACTPTRPGTKVRALKASYKPHRLQAPDQLFEEQLFRAANFSRTCRTIAQGGSRRC